MINTNKTNTNFGAAAVAAVLLLKQYEREEKTACLFSITRTSDSWSFSICVLRPRDGRFDGGTVVVSAQFDKNWRVTTSFDTTQDQSFMLELTREFKRLLIQVISDKAYLSTFSKIVESVPFEEVGSTLVLDVGANRFRVDCVDRRAYIAVVAHLEQPSDFWWCVSIHGLGWAGTLRGLKDSAEVHEKVGEALKTAERHYLDWSSK